MSKFCPFKNGPALYLDCKECDDHICDNRVSAFGYISKDGELFLYTDADIPIKKVKLVKKHRLSDL